MNGWSSSPGNMLGFKGCRKREEEICLGRQALSCKVRREDPNESFQELSTIGAGEATDPAVRRAV